MNRWPGKPACRQFVKLGRDQGIRRGNLEGQPSESEARFYGSLPV
ncbi:hypothetical protein RB3917 [Rhodopirellula baltica SH 1]|uniref:Uncharacterized protein n=1 Tax=Rhodopirellula baltica (strain DSM 10527 / NCIMB 13988 / SH1) TaxID=243090 RepID=Q7UTF3_RHOBA|nr:hypothetical protein RB3917 [Rhodopirellula baltica SH 1]